MTAEEESLRDTKWQTKQGRMLMVRFMSDSHLINALLFLEELYQAHIQKVTMELMCASLTVRGEMAEYYYDQQIREMGERAAIMDEELQDDVRYRAMLLELELRGIDYGSLFEYDIAWAAPKA